MSIPFVPAVDNACCLVIANFALTSPLYIRGVISTEVDFDVDQRGVEEGFGLFDVSIRSAPTGEARLATACVLLNTRNNLVYDFSVAPPFIAFTVVGKSPCPVRKMIGDPSLFAKRVCNSKPVMSGSSRSRMTDMCLNLDRLDGILIEMVVEEHEPDWGTILAHSADFTYVAKTKILAGNNSNQ